MRSSGTKGARAASVRAAVARNKHDGGRSRAEVYRTDPGLFTGVERVRAPSKLPRPGTREREQLEKLVLEDVRAGKRYADIAQEWGVSASFVNTMALAHGLRRRAVRGTGAGRRRQG